jgi:hypothetical protein
MYESFWINHWLIMKNVFTSPLFVIVHASRKTMDETSFVLLVVGASCWKWRTVCSSLEGCNSLDIDGVRCRFDNKICLLLEVWVLSWNRSFIIVCRLVKSFVTISKWAGPIATYIYVLIQWIDKGSCLICLVTDPLVLKLSNLEEALIKRLTGSRVPSW